MRSSRMQDVATLLFLFAILAVLLALSLAMGRPATA